MANKDQHPKDTDALSGVETTGHDWDGIKELNNPAPRWWLWVMFACVLYALGYMLVYPTWPTLSGHTGGSKNWSEYKQLKEQQAEITALHAKYDAAFDKASLQDIQNNKELYEYAVAGGKAAFRANCIVCHGSGAQGGPGYPNLNDDDWVWGGSLDQIYATIRYGARSSSPQGHQGNMLSFGKDGTLKPEEVEQVATYVQNLHLGDKAPATPAFTKGKEVFAANCVACHGDNGEGNQDMGAPRLNDNIWLYGGDLPTIIETITNGRAGVMPTWEGRLSDRTIKQLTIYVHSLGGGK